MKSTVSPHTLGPRSRRLDWRMFILPLVLLSAWEWASHQDAAHTYAFTPLETVGTTLWELLRGADLWINLGASLKRTLWGFAIGVLLGISCGTVMATSRYAERAIAPLYHMLRQIPLIGLIPLLSLWFGNGECAKILVVMLASFYPVVLNTYEGFSGIDSRHIEVANVLELNRTWRLFQVLLPAALPSIITGVLQALPFAWISAVGSELFFNAGSGLGALMLNAQAGARMDVLVIAVLAVTVLGSAMNTICVRFARRLTRWERS